jgi:antitoxin (DNA-binding transcriptional repressor) of toxin-antitoxin stability system
MNETVLTLDEAARCLPELVERIHATGEPALLFKSGQAIARIEPVSAGTLPVDDLIAFLRRWRIEHPDPDEQFADAIEASRSAVRAPHDPWQ